MEELNEILRRHAENYPAMEPVDAVKLIYQNEFGGSHLIADEAAFFARLRGEYAATPKDPAARKTEELGNGIVRIYLAPLTDGEVEQLGRDFLESARTHRGSQERFRQKLEVLRELTQEGIFSFDLQALDAFLRDYLAAGCPMVSHSEAYRNAYHPAYRVIRK